MTLSVIGAVGYAALQDRAPAAERFTTFGLVSLFFLAVGAAAYLIAWRVEGRWATPARWVNAIRLTMLIWLVSFLALGFGAVMVQEWLR
jgi:hypothetical protein